MNERGVVSTFDALLAIALLSVAGAVFMDAILAPAASASGEAIDDLQRASRLIRVAPIVTVPQVEYRDGSGLERAAQGESLLSLLHIMASLQPCVAPCDDEAIEEAVTRTLASLAEPGLVAVVVVEPAAGAPFAVPDVELSAERSAFALAMPNGVAHFFVWEA